MLSILNKYKEPFYAQFDYQKKQYKNINLLQIVEIKTT